MILTDESGCTIEENVHIFVPKNRHVYIPNIFSPNGDGINDIILIFSDDKVLNIKSFDIYDRWGEHVFHEENFQPNNPEFGWD